MKELNDIMRQPDLSLNGQCKIGTQEQKVKKIDNILQELKEAKANLISADKKELGLETSVISEIGGFFKRFR